MLFKSPEPHETCAQSRCVLENCTSTTSHTTATSTSNHARHELARKFVIGKVNRLHMLIDHLMCRDGELEDLLLERRAMKTCRCTTDFSNRGWDVPQVCFRAPALSSSETSKSTVPWSLTRTVALSRTFAASCCRDGSLAVAQPLWSRKLPRFHRCLNGWRQLTLAHTRRAMPSPV